MSKGNAFKKKFNHPSFCQNRSKIKTRKDLLATSEVGPTIWTNKCYHWKKEEIKNYIGK